MVFSNMCLSNLAAKLVKNSDIRKSFGHFFAKKYTFISNTLFSAKISLTFTYHLYTIQHTSTEQKCPKRVNLNQD